MPSFGSASGQWAWRQLSSQEVLGASFRLEVNQVQADRFGRHGKMGEALLGGQEASAPHSQQTTLLWQIVLILCYADACFSPDFWEYDNRWINMRGSVQSQKETIHVWRSEWLLLMNDLFCLHGTQLLELQYLLWEYIQLKLTYFLIFIYIYASTIESSNCRTLSLTLPKPLKYLLVRQQTLSSGDQILKITQNCIWDLSLCAKKLLCKIGQDDHLSCSECKQTELS